MNEDEVIFTCYSSFCAAEARARRPHLYFVLVSVSRYWISSHCTDANHCNEELHKCCYLQTFSVSLFSRLTHVCSKAAGNEMETQTMKPAAAAVGCMAVMPVCSLCRTITMDRLTGSKNLTSLSCRFARVHKLQPCSYESDTKARPFFGTAKVRRSLLCWKKIQNCPAHLCDLYFGALILKSYNEKQDPANVWMDGSKFCVLMHRVALHCVKQELIT